MQVEIVVQIKSESNNSKKLFGETWFVMGYLAGCLFMRIKTST